MPKPFSKYHYYKEAVQSPEEDVEFFQKIYSKIYKQPARLFREDFCGTFCLGIAWIKANKKNQAVVIDKDPQPLNYGKTNYLPELSQDEKARLQILCKNVSSPELPEADIISVTNFSYYIFKSRLNLLNYFKSVRSKLKQKGLFIIDSFGGSEAVEDHEEEVEHDDFSYFWDQTDFNSITNEARFHIHFKRKGEPKRKNVFTYDWRVWSLPELKDILLEAGFSKVDVYWEGSDEEGDGNNIFQKANYGEPCDSWIAYLISQP